MSTGTLDPSGRLALYPRSPIPRRRTARRSGAMAIAVAQSFVLLALLVVGALPHLLTSRLRPKRL